MRSWLRHRPRSARRLVARCLVARRLAALLFAAALGLAAGGCVTVRLVGAYDAQVDEGATRLQRGMDAFLTRLASVPADDASRTYAPNRTFYIDYGVDLRALEMRAASLPRNTITVQQLEGIERSVEQLRAVHEAQNGLSTAVLPAYRDQFNQSWRAILTLELAKRGR